MENWKAIRNYEGLYEVSDLGRSRKNMAFLTMPSVTLFWVRTGNGLVDQSKKEFSKIEALTNEN